MSLLQLRQAAPRVTAGSVISCAYIYLPQVLCCLLPPIFHGGLCLTSSVFSGQPCLPEHVFG